MAIKPLNSESEYQRALRRVEALWDSPKGSSESDELEMLVMFIESYEREHYPIDSPDPVEPGAEPPR